MRFRGDDKSDPSVDGDVGTNLNLERQQGRAHYPTKGAQLRSHKNSLTKESPAKRGVPSE
jgi:hypothetical protein